MKVREGLDGESHARREHDAEGRRPQTGEESEVWCGAGEVRTGKAPGSHALLVGQLQHFFS